MLHRPKTNMERVACLKLLRFSRTSWGVTAIEYGLIAAGISVVIITAVNMVGTSLNATFTHIANKLK